MPKAYWINTFRAVHDPDKLAAYAALAGPIMHAGGGASWREACPPRPTSWACSSARP